MTEQGEHIFEIIVGEYYGHHDPKKVVRKAQRDADEKALSERLDSLQGDIQAIVNEWGRSNYIEKRTGTAADQIIKRILEG